MLKLIVPVGLHVSCPHSGLHADDISGTGQIGVSPQMEQGVSSENKVPRVTMSHWRFAEGGVGSLTHTVALKVYSLEMKWVWGSKR